MNDIQVIAEFGQSARGDLNVAIDQAFAAKAAGCYAVKYQTFRPDRLVSKDAARYWDPALGGSDTQLATFEQNGMLTTDQWRALKEACDNIGIVFLSSPFDLEAVELLDDLDVAAIKIASGEITHKQMLQKVAATGRPVILSTGGANPREIYRALDWLAGCPVSLLACDLVYPCPPERANLSRIEGLMGFPVSAVGYSDHTPLTTTALAATVLGATILEKHCRLDESDGVCPDDQMALRPAELKEYCRLAQLGASMKGIPYPGCSDAERPAKVGARRSLHAAKYFRKGHIFSASDFVCLRPGDGAYEPADVDRLVGRKAARAIRVGTNLTTEDVA